MKPDVVIVGAGFAGAVLAERLASQKGKKVLIIEKRSHIGGNCYDERASSGIIIHKYGPHLFHTPHSKVFDYLSQFTDWQPYEHRVLARVDGQLVPVPFNFNSIDKIFGSARGQVYQDKLLRYFEWNQKVPILELKKVDDSDLRFLADFIYKKIFLGYTLKQWGVTPEQIDPEVTARVPVFIGRDDRYFNDPYQCVPKEGYTSIFKKMLAHSNIKILLNCDYREVVKVDFNAKKIWLFDEPFCGHFVFTGMIDEFCDYQFGPLPYRGLRFEFKTEPMEFFQPAASVNYPNDFNFTRITEFKHIHPTPAFLSATEIVKEYPAPFKVGDVPYYPVFDAPSRAMYERYKDLIGSWPNFYLVGRLAEYRYYDMDDVVDRALQVFEQIQV